MHVMMCGMGICAQLRVFGIAVTVGSFYAPSEARGCQQSGWVSTERSGDRCALIRGFLDGELAITNECGSVLIVSRVEPDAGSAAELEVAAGQEGRWLVGPEDLARGVVELRYEFVGGEGTVKLAYERNECPAASGDCSFAPASDSGRGRESLLCCLLAGAAVLLRRKSC